jgi:hypothetical protein
VEIDHVFVCCAPGAPEADALRHIGLAEGSGNVHPGQGTANRRFVFANAYLELLWVADEREARSAAAQRTRLWERWSARSSHANPFGILLRPERDGERPPFATWAYRPSYLPPGTAIEFADGVPLDEPEIAWLPFVRGAQPRPVESVDQSGPFRELVALRAAVPDVAAICAAACAVRDAAPLAYCSGAPLLELVFDCAPEVVHDLRPLLPLVLRGR